MRSDSEKDVEKGNDVFENEEQEKFEVIPQAISTLCYASPHAYVAAACDILNNMSWIELDLKEGLHVLLLLCSILIVPCTLLCLNLVQ